MASPAHRPAHFQANSSGYNRRGGRVLPHLVELSQCLLDFVVQLLPTKEEVSVKEDVRKLLERLIRTIEPSSQLLSFGSTANGFELKNSDMDLCCVLDVRPETPPNASQFVLRAAQLLERETKFAVKPLPNARIPIIKLSLQPSPSIPFGIACDIGFENRLALENTRLLFTYAAIDPTRVRTLVLFLKLWAKRRKINSPYHGTLSSYGYALLVIFFLVHVKDPPVLPNLQQMPPMRPISPSETHIDGRNVWFFDDIELLRRKWQSPNTETIGELLLDFFRYFSRDFSYGTSVASIRAGHLSKETKVDANKPPDPREGTSLWIEDPFATDFNVGRCVTRDGLYTIRGEFMRALRILNTKHEPAGVSLATLCEERESEVPQSAQRNSFRHNVDSPRSRSAGVSPVIPRLNLAPAAPQEFKPQFAPSTPITISSPDSLQAPTFVPAVLPPTMVPPPHMAPQRAKWTSPPPDHAPPQRHNSFNEKLESGIKLAVSHPPMLRTATRSSTGSSATDDDVDDVLDVNTRSSSPASSTGPLIAEFKPRTRAPPRIQEAVEEEHSSTPKPFLPQQSQHGRFATAPATVMDAKNRDYTQIHSTLPTISIPSQLPFFPPPPYSANALQWSMDYGYGFAVNPPPRANPGYQPPRHGRYNSHKSYTPTTSFGANHSRISPMVQHVAPFSLPSPQQLPTPPVSSPCSNQQHSPTSPQAPLLRLDEPSAR
ncbi:Terminal uridylyltransferase cid1 {ECO:0000305} Short=TUTase cid1 {ECO:0000305}; {ECO:0000269/PubMed:12218190, ECO:0000269/PubMed:22751018, ECO:0000269/PubMed:22885303, ECO:0000269/PubMed:24322298, ECO:0000269/PubMed:25712096}; {ECO:0000269/PubMed:17353264, ECO:0000269/PubMed:17449726, ECO:0000269/PubMed:19430462, ECO:0000269/PubMed:22751018, ECO:0000269/PubMed:22885303, ECO:0000269/PubMed:24322298}; AltName: Full=Caffeine-induced death protein 1 {ECO:0000303/PubMed:10757807}; AltName: Full=Poly(A) polymer|uniref:polynucleotide adenylyltransferase n=1 Tax=Serendipita indica (strain DSM 11827) TaxID=1109443 RepID=G4TG25_SERID|nr:Terminal uridylyltransferase cid1 {ECO:0000305} Short=TUTase cid1 {ECO:0000305}; {ECO:0000269/PubMed:12218190, ECO:0000269/PubMed:22751018, ECO:0000269/PubMed:22885303, ECO:0000269/PubMed:24322298, ECO:0000269/PubMed:25712096}; {ECO:0000269/PubMed:17353264, ECO:0000269/PubMed:17449726, ECO:0000269/PubMed:19430462, ECO:0000269/PubMed:22751018, ECO:0000269/PubMed:22885303, ECO:0000269/PubMed:24322298}; AltName: Full=Caffeine-induced death protein 1 {ECO:0000303/PubMed:10757807}; AltName: Full=Poly